MERTIEQRLTDLELAQEAGSTAMQAMFALVQQIDANMSNVVARTQALETNFSLLNAKVDGIDKKVDALGTKVDALGTKVDALNKKVDQILVLMRSPDSTQQH